MTPAASIPWAKAVARSRTVSTSCPYSRSHLPMGPLSDGFGMSTRSATGARFMVIPTSAISWPHPWALATRSSPDAAACSEAGGMSEKPSPPRTWTWPPSWSVATSIGASWVVSGPTRPVREATMSRTEPAPERVGLAMKTFPTWWVDTASSAVA